MNVVVIGSGLCGVTSAYFLRQDGHDVTVIDRQEGSGRETSFANGALLTPSMTEPWNAPGCWRVLLASLVRSDTPLQLRRRALAGLALWGVKFLRNSSTRVFERNAISNLRLALFSIKMMEELRQQTNVQYGGTARGTLRLFRSTTAFEAASRPALRFAHEGLEFRTLSRDETITLEPSLVSIAEELSGAIYCSADEVGDAYQFCVALTEHARTGGVDFCFGTTVSALKAAGDRLVSVETDRGSFVADHYVLAAGSYSAPLLRQVGIGLPVQPAKGYSVTFDFPSDGNPFKIPVVDDDMHAALVPVGDKIRAAGTAEFAGYDLTLRPERVQNLVNLTRKIFPHAGLDPATARPWCGLRPMSADGVPLVGRTTLSNLWTNTGHGHLGWTLAAGSARLLADLVSGCVTGVEAAPYDPCRFQNAG